jgi:hypothetical protein
MAAMIVHLQEKAFPYPPGTLVMLPDGPVPGNLQYERRWLPAFAGVEIGEKSFRPAGEIIFPRTLVFLAISTLTVQAP